jgi:hypothetical protein
VENGGITARNAQLKEPWKPGQSGNPSGRPKEIPGLRKACLVGTFEALEHLMAGLRDPDVPFRDKVLAFEAIADRGGLLPVDKEAKVVLAVLALDLTKEQRDSVIKHIKAVDE